MADTPWLGDACALVDAFRRGERSPVEELDATVAALEHSGLNAICHLDLDDARRVAAAADVHRPFGGVPIAVKELDSVAGWPATEASVPLRDRVASEDSILVTRLRGAGAVLFGQSTASEFGGVNLTRTKLHGVTRNPWSVDRTPGGSSGGAAAAVAGGLCSVATAGDGGGSIRIPAGFCGLVGLKNTYGRIPKGPRTPLGGLTAVVGCVSRSVRDTARWLDVCNGRDGRDPLSLPRVDGWEAGLGSHLDSLRGRRVAILPAFGGAYVVDRSWAVIGEAAAALIERLGLRRVDVAVEIPNMGTAWSLAGLWEIFADLGERWPGCADELTPEIRYGLSWAEGKYGMTARIKLEQRRADMNAAMAAMFDAADLVITATNPDVAFAAEGPLPSVFGGQKVGGWNNGRLTAPANLYGNPAISVPAGLADGLPVGMQIMAAHHEEALLLDCALLLERERPWPLVAPAAPC